MTTFLKDPIERTRFLKFAVVGTIGAAIDFSIFNLLINIFRFNPIVASVVSFCTAVASNFVWNRFWTYPESRSKPIAHQLSQFGFVNLAGLLIRTPIFALLEPVLGKEFRLLRAESYGLHPDFLGHNLALAAAVGVVLLWNFFVNRYWTYNDI